MTFGQRLGSEFFERFDVTNQAQELLGMVLRSSIDGQQTSGIIVETEAYKAPDDKASHAYNNRRTARTEIMFHRGGLTYVYLCYGIHHLFNIVTATEDVAHAILVRAIEPVEGTDIMMTRRKLSEIAPRLTSGPGSLSKAMGITLDHNAIDMTDLDSPIWIENPHIEKLPAFDIIASPRVGVDYAEECASWPWRYRIEGNRWTSPAK